MGNYVVVDKLTKKYGDVCAVDTLSFTVEEGEIFGFLGPNGAGKSTTLNVLTTLTDFDRGTVTINGWDLSRDRDRVKPLIAFSPRCTVCRGGSGGRRPGRRCPLWGWPNGRGYSPAGCREACGGG